MMNHYHKRYLWYLITISLFGSLVIALGLFGSLFIEEDAEAVVNFETIDFLYLIGLYVVIEITTVVFIVLKWYVTTYTLTDDAIILKKGIIFKYKKTLPYSKINAIDYKQSLIQKIFKIKKLSLDSGSTTKADEAEIVIVEDSVKVGKLIKQIRSKIGFNDEEFEVNYIYKYSIKEKLIDSFFKSLSIIVFVVIALSLVFIFIHSIGEHRSPNAILNLIFTIIVTLFLVFCATFLFSTIRYYDYKAIIENNYLIISYGIIKKVNNTLPLNRIKAIKVEEGFIKRLFKFCSIKLEIVGFGSLDNNTLANYYIPFCHKSKVNKYIDKLKLEFRYYEREEKAPRRSLKYFYTLPILIFTIIYLSFIPIVFIFDELLYIYICLYLFLFILIFLTVSLLYKSTGIYYDDHEMIVYGGAFNKRGTIILNKNITGIEKVDTYCRNKNNIASYLIHFYNNAIKNVEVAYYLENKIYDELIKLVRY